MVKRVDVAVKQPVPPANFTPGNVTALGLKEGRRAATTRSMHKHNERPVSAEMCMEERVDAGHDTNRR